MYVATDGQMDAQVCKEFVVGLQDGDDCKASSILL